MRYESFKVKSLLNKYLILQMITNIESFQWNLNTSKTLNLYVTRANLDKLS